MLQITNEEQRRYNVTCFINVDCGSSWQNTHFDEKHFRAPQGHSTDVSCENVSRTRPKISPDWQHLKLVGHSKNIPGIAWRIVGRWDWGPSFGPIAQFNVNEWGRVRADLLRRPRGAQNSLTHVTCCNNKIPYFSCRALHTPHFFYWLARTTIPFECAKSI